jgi:ribosomal protein S18 acetylase RimI-like enzyme
VTIEVRPIAVERTRELRHTVLRPHGTLEEIVSHETPGSRAVGAFVGDELVGVGMVSPAPPPEGWRIRGMATAPEWRGRGAGSAVLGALVAIADGEGAERLWCNARTPALSLYERAGFVPVGEEFELPMIGPHFVMERWRVVQAIP